MRRWLSVSVVLAATVGTFLVAGASPASARVLNCTSGDFATISWNQGGSNWGRAKFCGEIGGSYKVMTDDILTDGHCVHGEVYQNGSWSFVQGSESCGPVSGPTPWSFGNYTTTEVRLVRGGSSCVNFGPCNGVGTNYFTFQWD